MSKVAVCYAASFQSYLCRRLRNAMVNMKKTVLRSRSESARRTSSGLITAFIGIVRIIFPDTTRACPFRRIDVTLINSLLSGE
jgi:hypothetical protein